MAALAPAAHRLVVADELGMLKVVEVPAGPRWSDAAVVQTWGAPDRAQAVQVMRASTTHMEPGAPCMLAVGRRTGAISLLDPQAGGQLLASCCASTSGKLEPTQGVPGLEFLGAHGEGGGCSTRLLSVSSGGAVRLHVLPDDVAQRRPEGPGGEGQHAAAVTLEASCSFQASKDVACAALESPSDGALLLGGDGCQPSLWDLAQQQQVWQAKGGKPDMLGLVDKVHITALAPLAAGGGDGGGGRRRFVAGNASHKLLLYDPGAGRRPQLEVSWGGARITALAVEPGGLRVWAANGSGHMEALDLRAAAPRMQGALKGAGGSLRCLGCHPQQALLASTGLDRFVRLHHTDSRSLAARVYLKQQLTALAWLPPGATPAAAGGAGEAQQGGKEAVAAVAQQGATAEAAGNGVKRRTGRGEGGGSGNGAGGSQRAGHKKQRSQKGGDREGGSG